MDWYKSWHNHPSHRHVHLLIFFSVLFVVIAFLFTGFLNFYLERHNIAAAQAPIDIGNVDWGPDANASNWTEGISLSRVEFQGDQLCLYSNAHDILTPNPDPYPNGTNVLEGNFWIFVYSNGQWRAGTYEYFRDGDRNACQNSEGVNSYGYNGGANRNSALGSSWTPSPGTTYGFMVSSLARNNGITGSNGDIRSNIVMAQWTGAVPGGTGGVGGEFDLSRPNNTFYQYIERYTNAAKDRNIYTLLAVYNMWLDDPGEGWGLNPFNPVNNINSETDYINGPDMFATELTRAMANDMSSYSTGRQFLRSVWQNMVSRLAQNTPSTVLFQPLSEPTKDSGIPGFDRNIIINQLNSWWNKGKLVDNPEGRNDSVCCGASYRDYHDNSNNPQLLGPDTIVNTDVACEPPSNSTISTMSSEAKQRNSNYLVYDCSSTTSWQSRVISSISTALGSAQPAVNIGSGTLIGYGGPDFWLNITANGSYTTFLDQLKNAGGNLTFALAIANSDIVSEMPWIQTSSPSKTPAPTSEEQSQQPSRPPFYITPVSSRIAPGGKALFKAIRDGVDVTNSVSSWSSSNPSVANYTDTNNRYAEFTGYSVGVTSIEAFYGYASDLATITVDSSYYPSPGSVEIPLPATVATPCDSSEIFPNIITICDFYPKSVKPGEVVSISGSFMGNVVQFSNESDGIVTEIVGQVNSSYDLLLFEVPLGTPDGLYTLSVVSNDGASNGSTSTPLVVAKNVNVPPLQPPTGQPPFQSTAPIANPPATNFQDLISNAFNYAVILVGIAVFMMILWAGFLWLTSTANPGNIATAKRYISNAIIGGILLLSSYVILYTINPELTRGTFNLGGIPVPTNIFNKTPTQNSDEASTQSLVAFTEPQAASAVTSGCIITTEKQDFTAIDCPTDADLISGLVNNPILNAMDTEANNQVGATVLQNGGNQGAGKKIVVLDTGYNYIHPELSSSYLGGKDFINNDSDPMDDHTAGIGSPGHGSHVAGIITADGIDSRARGVAPQTGIIAGKILNFKGEGSWDRMIDAIYWAVDGPDSIPGTADDFKADVINISIGGGIYSSTCDNVDDITRRTAKAFQYAKDNEVLVVVSAGNSSNGISMPGCIGAALTIGAVDSSDRITSWSGRGSTIDIVAPGVNIYSALLGNSYGTKSGTSQATPVVSGIAALIKTANPSYSVAELEQKLTSSVCDLGSTGKDNIFGWGRVSGISGGCTLAPSQPTPPNRITGTLTASPASCTKEALPANPSCNVILNYKINGVISPTQLMVKKDGSIFQSIQCNSDNCTGQLNDPDPTAGDHTYTINLPDNSLVAQRNVYIYATGTIAASFSSCAKSANSSNPNCDVDLYLNAPGIAPGSVVLTKDGINWRIIQCKTPSCSTKLTDTNPDLGIHTYTIQNPVNNSRLARATVTITAQTKTAIPLPSVTPGPAVTKCNSSKTTCLTGQFWPNGTLCGNVSNLGNGPCVVLDHKIDIQDITSSLTNGSPCDPSSALYIGPCPVLDGQDGFVVIVRDGSDLLNVRSLDKDFAAGTRIDKNLLTPGPHTYQLLDGMTREVIVSFTITVFSSALIPSSTENTIILCSEINYEGDCEIFASNDVNLSDNLIGDNEVSSMILNTNDVRLCTEINYGGTCENFTTSDPNLSDNKVGNDQASSIGSM